MPHVLTNLGYVFVSMHVSYTKWKCRITGWFVRVQNIISTTKQTCRCSCLLFEFPSYFPNNLLLISSSRHLPSSGCLNIYSHWNGLRAITITERKKGWSWGGRADAKHIRLSGSSSFVWMSAFFHFPYLFFLHLSFFSLLLVSSMSCL